MATESAQQESSPTRYRIEPSIGVAIAAALAYMVVCSGIQLSSGIEYKDWFDNADNAYRTAVLPLAVCSALLAAFLAWARWDIVWRDPGRLMMSTLMRAILILFLVAVALRLVGIQWGDVPGDFSWRSPSLRFWSALPRRRYSAVSSYVACVPTGAPRGSQRCGPQSASGSSTCRTCSWEPVLPV